MTEPQWDVLIKGALLFDGTGQAPKQADVALLAGKVAAVQPGLDAAQAKEVVNAEGKWVTPGLWDIHTHLDLEVELDPSLSEIVRHGSTSAVVANCSIGVAFGRQNEDGHDPVVSCFARVENMPKPVLRRVADKITWNSTAGYLQHLAELPMGANVLPLIPHSMLRIEAMGLENSVSRPPNEDELKKMDSLLEDAMQQGYLGFSTDALPFHYLSNDPHRQHKIPTHYANYSELKRLTHIVRRHDRVWQATPPKDSPINVFRTFLLSSGRLFGKTLKTTAVAALDVVTNRNLVKLGRLMSRIINSKLIKGRFHLQALAAPFRVYMDGMITPLAEENTVLRELNEIDLDDREARMQLLNAPDYCQRFRKMWYSDKRGVSLARLKRKLSLMDETLSRELSNMIMSTRPIAQWEGQSLQQIYNRLLAFQAGDDSATLDAERELFNQLPKPIGDDCEFMLELLRRFDTQLRWYEIVANDNAQRLEQVLFDPLNLPGFNDSGAHIANMAFYDGNLRGLQLAQKTSLDKVATLVHRLTQVPAEFFDVSGVGLLQPGQRADVILIDPEQLQQYDSEANTIFEHRDALGAEQMLNRSPGLVTDVWIAGQSAWRNGQPTEQLGKQKMGVALTKNAFADASQADSALAQAA